MNDSNDPRAVILNVVSSTPAGDRLVRFAEQKELPSLHDKTLFLPQADITLQALYFVGRLLKDLYDREHSKHPFFWEGWGEEDPRLLITPTYTISGKLGYVLSPRAQQREKAIAAYQDLFKNQLGLLDRPSTLVSVPPLVASHDQKTGVTTRLWKAGRVLVRGIAAPGKEMRTFAAEGKQLVRNSEGRGYDSYEGYRYDWRKVAQGLLKGAKSGGRLFAQSCGQARRELIGKSTPPTARRFNGHTYRS